MQTHKPLLCHIKNCDKEISVKKRQWYDWFKISSIKNIKYGWPDEFDINQNGLAKKKKIYGRIW